jgi:hypothetical protein
VTRRRAGLVAIALVTLGASMLASPSPAGAATLSKSAWWYQARTGDPSTVIPPQAGPLPGGVPTAPAPPTPAPPTVPEGSLLVEGTASGATAIAAMTFTMSSSEAAPVLTIKPSETSQVPAEAIVLACRAAVEWSAPDQSPGAWEEKPLVACDQSVQGIPGDGGITFALAPLCQACTTLDIVLVPGVVATPAPTPAPVGSTFSLAFDAKSGATLVTAGGASSDSSTFEPGSSPSYAGGTASTGYAAPGSFATPATPTVPVAQPALEPQEQAPSVPQQTALPALKTTSRDKTAQGVAFLILLAGLAFAGLAYATPARAEDGTIGLGRFRRPVEGAVSTEPIDPVSGGLGRFARPRTGPPPALS